MAQDLTGGIRRAAEPPRRAGYSAPSTAGVNQGDPSLSAPVPATQPAGGSAPAFPSAVGRHEDHGWHEMQAVEHRAYTETLVALSLAAGDTLTIDPTRAQVWRVAVAGAATIAIPNPSFPEAATARQDAPERKRSWSCVLIVSVPSGVAFPTITGAKWAEGRTAPDLTLPNGSTPASYAGRYVFTFVADPVSGDVLGFEGGSRF